MSVLRKDFSSLFFLVVQLAKLANMSENMDHHAMSVISEEKKLIKELIKKYDEYGKIGRPVHHKLESVRVEYGLSLIQIMNLDEKNQILTTNVWCKYRWEDHFLSWNKSDYLGLNMVRIPIDRIWQPDIVLYNYADERLTEHRNAMAVINSKGHVTWIPPAIFKSTCEMDTTNFPFDEQFCSLKFGSWTYNGNALDPFFFENKEYVSLDDYVRSQEWIILEHHAYKSVQYYQCCPNEPYPALTFFISLRRKAAFFKYILILPCVLLSTVTIVLFILPPESPAKMQLGINIFVAFFLLLLLLKDSTPLASHRIPLIGAYYCFNMIMTIISTFLCAIIVDLHFRADKRGPPPAWLKKLLINVTARALCIRVPKKKKKKCERRQSLVNKASRHILKPEVALPYGAHLPASRTTSQICENVNELNEVSLCQPSQSPARASRKSLLARSVSCQGMPPQSPSIMSDAVSPDDAEVSPTASDISPVHLPLSAELELREIRRLAKKYVHRLHLKQQTNRGASEWRIIGMVRLLNQWAIFVFLMVLLSKVAITSMNRKNTLRVFVFSEKSPEKTLKTN